MSAGSEYCRARPTAKLKAWVLHAQGNACLNCNKALKDVEFDHVVPLCLGGGNKADNWAALCPACHRQKTKLDLARLAKANRQRRYHETGRGRSSSTGALLPGLGLTRGFDKSLKRHFNGVTTRVCICRACARGERCERQRGG